MNNSDGSLIFDTELDSTGFEKGSAKMERSMQRLVQEANRIGGILEAGLSTPKQMASFQSKIDSAKNSVEQLESQINELGQQTISTVEYENVTKAIEKAEKALFKLYDRRDTMSDLGVSESSTQWQRLQIQIQNAEAELERYENLKNSIESSGQAFVSGADTAEYQNLSNSLADVISRLEEYEQAKLNMESDGAEEKVSRLRTALDSVGNAASRAAGWIAKMTFKTFTAGITGAVSALKRFVSQSNKSALSAKSLLKPLTSLKSMLFSRAKRMFISYIFNEMKESLSALEKYSSSFGAAMNNMKNSCKMLGSNLAVTFGNLITAIEPVITTIINLISKAVTYLNAFFALLGGKSTMTVAKKQMKDYTKETDGAAKAAKELNKQLMGFDEINKMNAPKEDSSGGGTNPNDLFEEVPIDSILSESAKDFFNQLKAAFEAGDYEGIGALLAGKLNDMVQKVKEAVSWDNIGEKITSVVDVIVGVINGLSHNINFHEIGAMFGELANTIVNTFDLLLTGIDWKSLGANISQGLYGLIATIDWGNVGATLSHLMMVLPKAIIGAVQGINWYELGKMLFNGLVSFVTGVDWAGLASTAAEMMGSLFGGAVALLWGIIKSAWNAVVDWWHDIAYEDGQFTIEGLLNGIWEGIKNIGSWIVENIFKPFIDGFKKAFGIASPSKVMMEQGGFITDGLLKGLTDTWGNITSFFGGAVSGIKESLSSGWNTIKETATSAWESIKTTVTGKFTATQQRLESGTSAVSTFMSSGWENVKSTTSSLWNATSESVSAVFSAMQSRLGGSMSSLMAALTNGWRTIQNTTSTTWTTISSTVQGKWNDLQSVLRRTDWASIGSGICSGIRNGINAGWQWLKSTVSDLASSLLRSAKSALGIHSPSRVFRDEVGRNVGLGLAEGISDTEQNVAATVSNLAKTAVDAFGNPELTADVAGAEMVNGLDAVAERLTTIVDSFQAIASVLEALGGLLMPDIAVGTVVPPKIKSAVYAAENDNGGGSDVSSKLDMLMDFMIQGFEAIVKSIDEKDTSFVIGDEEIWDANNRHNNKMNMIRGSV